MVDATYGYAVTGAYPRYHLVATADAGRTWKDITPVHPSGAATVAGRTIVFGTQIGPKTFAVERSDDGGGTWRMSQPFHDSHTGGIGAPDLVDSRHLYVAIGEGAAAGSEAESLWASTDGGATWHFVSRTGFASTKPGQLPFGCDKDGYAFSTPAAGWATGFCAGGRPFLYRTRDGGHTWHQASLPGLRSCQCNVAPPQFSGARVGVIAVTGSVARMYWTRDGGATWRGSARPVNGVVYDVAVAGFGSAWFVTKSSVIRTLDAGAVWRRAPLPFDAGTYGLDAVSATTAFAFGASVLETTDGGAHWRGLPVYPSCPLLEPDASMLHGDRAALVPPGATSVVLCRYGYQLTASARAIGNAVVQLTNELDALPALSTAISCPVSLDSVLATFHYRRGPARTVRVDLTGCAAAANGTLVRRSTEAVRRLVEHIAAPRLASNACTPTQLGVSVKTQGENTTAWIGITVQNRAAPCVAKRVPVTVAVPGSRLTMYASGTFDHGGAKLLVADWSNWCGRSRVSVTVEAGTAEAVAPVRPLPVCLQRSQPSRLSASR